MEFYLSTLIETYMYFLLISYLFDITHRSDLIQVTDYIVNNKNAFQ